MITQILNLRLTTLTIYLVKREINFTLDPRNRNMREIFTLHIRVYNKGFYTKFHKGHLGETCRLFKQTRTTDINLIRISIVLSTHL